MRYSNQELKEGRADYIQLEAKTHDIEKIFFARRILIKPYGLREALNHLDKTGEYHFGKWLCFGKIINGEKYNCWYGEGWWDIYFQFNGKWYSMYMHQIAAADDFILIYKQGVFLWKIYDSVFEFMGKLFKKN